MLMVTTASRNYLRGNRDTLLIEISMTLLGDAIKLVQITYDGEPEAFKMHSLISEPYVLN